MSKPEAQLSALEHTHLPELVMASSNDKKKTTFNFTKPGTSPPVFIAGSFTSPPWSPVEMFPSPKASTSADQQPEHVFTADIDALSPGEHQYKFRLGIGNEWTVDEESETIMDDAANRNNLIRIPEADKETPKSIPAAPEPLCCNYSTVAESDVSKSPSTPPLPSILARPSVIELQKVNDDGSITTTSTERPHVLQAIPEESPSTPEPESIPLPETPQPTDNRPLTPQQHLLRSTPPVSPSSAHHPTMTHTPYETTAAIAAEVAAEVSDTAAKLDRSPSEPELQLATLLQAAIECQTLASGYETLLNLPPEQQQEYKDRLEREHRSSSVKLPVNLKAEEDEHQGPQELGDPSDENDAVAEQDQTLDENQELSDLPLTRDEGSDRVKVVQEPSSSLDTATREAIVGQEREPSDKDESSARHGPSYEYEPSDKRELSDEPTDPKSSVSERNTTVAVIPSSDRPRSYLASIFNALQQTLLSVFENWLFQPLVSLVEVLMGRSGHAS